MYDTPSNGVFSSHFSAHFAVAGHLCLSTYGPQPGIQCVPACIHGASVQLDALHEPLCLFFVMREVYASSVTSRGEDSHEGLIHTVNSLFEY